jgi:L-fuconolactonase
MNIIDVHHHLWDTSVLKYSLFDGLPALQGRFAISDYEKIATAYDIKASVCVEAASAGADGHLETLWLLRESSNPNVVKRIVAWAPVGKPELQRYLEWLGRLGSELIVGLRRSFEFEEPELLESKDVIAGMKAIGRLGYFFELVLFEKSLASAVRLVRACPDTQFILDHAGKPRIKERIRQPWQDNIAALALMPNVVCKLSGLSTEATRDDWTKEDLRPYIDHVIERFGWDRVLFGSDWPVCNQAGGLKPWIDAALWATRDAGEGNRQKLFSENGRRIYRIPVKTNHHARQL